MLLASVVIAIVLFFIGIRLYWLEERIRSIKELRQRKLFWEAIREFLFGKYFLKIVEGILATILGVVVALGIGNMYEEVQNRQKLSELLQEAEREVASSVWGNDVIMTLYDCKSATLEFLCINAECDFSILEMILKNEEMIISMSTTSYSKLSDYVEIANESYQKIIEADRNDEEVYIKLKTLNSELDDILFQIQTEIKYLEGEYTLKELQEKTTEYWEANKTEIPWEEALPLLREKQGIE